MSSESARKVISRAVTDGEFRSLLFSNPDQALAGYDLTEEEQHALRGIPAETLDDFSSKLEERISMSILAFGADVYSGDAAGGNAAYGGHSAYGGNVMSGDAMSGDVMSGDVMSGDVMSGDVMSGDVMSGDAMSGDAMSGDVMSGDVMSGDAMGGESLGGAAAESASWLSRLAAALGFTRSGGGGHYDFY